MVFGRAYVRVDGEVLATKEGAKAVGIGGHEREPVMAESGMVGFKTTAAPCTLECTLIDQAGVSLSDIANKTNATVTFESQDDGKTYIMKGAFCKRNLELTAGEGEVPVVFIGKEWIEQQA